MISNTTSTVPLDESNYTPPGSPKVTVLKKAEPKSIISAARLPSKSDDSIDLSAIINPANKISKGKRSIFNFLCCFYSISFFLN